MNADRIYMTTIVERKLFVPISISFSVLIATIVY